MTGLRATRPIGLRPRLSSAHWTHRTRAGTEGLRTRIALDEAATKALKKVGATRWVCCVVTETPEATYHQDHRGRPGPDSRYVRAERLAFKVSAELRGEHLAYDAATDGCPALTTNDPNLSPADVLGAYHYQPNLERRNHLLKDPQQIAPMRAETPSASKRSCRFRCAITVGWTSSVR